MAAYIAWTIFDAIVDRVDFSRTMITDWITILDDEITQKVTPYHMQHLHDIGQVISKMHGIRFFAVWFCSHMPPCLVGLKSQCN
jgi:hypothetical protein